MSSRIDRERGIVTVSAPCYSTMPAGYQLYVVATYAARDAVRARLERTFDDYLARLALSQNGNGHAWGEGIAVLPPDGALLEQLGNGSLHPSLVAEPVQ